MMRPKEVYLRPHHGVCILNYRGHGYSDAFSVHMQQMVQTLTEHPETGVCIADSCDELCANCPHRRGETCTSFRPATFDQNVLQATGLAAGDCVTWAEFSRRTEPLSLYQLDEICPNCNWLSLCKEIAAERIHHE